MNVDYLSLFIRSGQGDERVEGGLPVATTWLPRGHPDQVAGTQGRSGSGRPLPPAVFLLQGRQVSIFQPLKCTQLFAHTMAVPL